MRIPRPYKQSAIALTALGLFVPTVVAHAINFNIVTGVPGPVNIEQTGLLGFIQNGYLLALGLAGLLAVGSITYGAIEYTLSRGNAAKLSDAWDRIIQALIGILLLVGAGTILTVINPGLLSLELPQLQQVESTPFSADTFEGEIKKGIEAIKANVNNVTYQKVTGGQCQPISAAQSAYCNPEALQAYGEAHNCSRNGQVWDGTFMSIACRQESRGNASQESYTDRCQNNGNNVTFSGGLFQINIIGEAKNPRTLFPACRNVMAVYDRSPGTPGCNGLDSSLGTCIAACKPAGTKKYCPLRKCGFGQGITAVQYNACLAQVYNPEMNLLAACNKYKTQGTSAWAGTASLIAKVCNR
jgi:hypothetical protein